jgi:2-C-methyl-D-erythritol 4-phosphate cytidylyltransferase
MRIVVVITGGGIGQRFGSKRPKQFLKLSRRSASKPLIMWSVHAFERRRQIEQIVITVPRDYIGYTERLIKRYTIRKTVSIIPGGTTRQESVFNALTALTDSPPDAVLIHDAVRPFVDKATIERVIEGLNHYPAVIPAIGLRDTVRRRGEKDVMGVSEDRNTLLLVQTPQAFRWEAISRALPRWLKYFNATDDASIVAKQGIEVGIVEGSPYNLKITTQEDLRIARGIARTL